MARHINFLPDRISGTIYIVTGQGNVSERDEVGIWEMGEQERLRDHTYGLLHLVCTEVE